MAQLTFTFHSPVDTKETIQMIAKSVSELNGSTKLDGNVVIAKWRSHKYQTVFPHKFTFYVGKDMVRVVTSASSMLNSIYRSIKWEYKKFQVVILWDEFIKTLGQIYSGVDFELEAGDFHIVSAKIMSDGIEKTFTSKSVSKPSIAGALIGGAFFGGVGAIVGGSRSKTLTSGKTGTFFSKQVLVAVRYSNGLNLEGEISKESPVYNRILAGLCEMNAN